MSGQPQQRPGEARKLARTVQLGRARLMRLKQAADVFGPTDAAFWLAPLPLGLALRHVFWAGEDADLWRFTFPWRRWPEGAEVDVALAQLWPDIFQASADQAQTRVQTYPLRETDDPDNIAFAEGLRRGDRLLAALRRGDWGDQQVHRAKQAYDSLKRDIGRGGAMFSPRRLYEFLIYNALLGAREPLHRADVARAIWPRSRPLRLTDDELPRIEPPPRSFAHSEF